MSASNHWLAIQNDPRFPPLAQRLGVSDEDLPTVLGNLYQNLNLFGAPKLNFMA
jgi:hypothetical protein